MVKKKQIQIILAIKSIQPALGYADVYEIHKLLGGSKRSIIVILSNLTKQNTVRRIAHGKYCVS